jgi:regulatory protein
MKITAIKRQERLKGRYSIYIDEKYAFSLSADALLEEKLHNGQEVDEPALAHYKKLSADDKAYGLALVYVVRRMRSRYELAEYFRRKDYDEALADHIIMRLEKLGLVDDEKFADATIDRVLHEDETDERAVLRELVTRKRKQSRYQDDIKLMRYLMGQGFNYDDVKSVLANDADD